MCASPLLVVGRQMWSGVGPNVPAVEAAEGGAPLIVPVVVGTESEKTTSATEQPGSGPGPRQPVRPGCGRCGSAPALAPPTPSELLLRSCQQ